MSRGPQLNLTMGNFLTMNRISIPGAEHGIHQLSHGGELDASQEVTLLQPFLTVGEVKWAAKRAFSSLKSVKIYFPAATPSAPGSLTLAQCAALSQQHGMISNFGSTSTIQTFRSPQRARKCFTSLICDFNREKGVTNRSPLTWNSLSTSGETPEAGVV